MPIKSNLASDMQSEFEQFLTSLLELFRWERRPPISGPSRFPWRSNVQHVPIFEIPFTDFSLPSPGIVPTAAIQTSRRALRPLRPAVQVGTRKISRLSQSLKRQLSSPCSFQPGTVGPAQDRFSNHCWSVYQRTSCLSFSDTSSFKLIYKLISYL